MTHLQFIMNADPSAMTDKELEEALSGAEALHRMMEIMSPAATLWDAALCGYARRDPLAIQFMHNTVPV